MNRVKPLYRYAGGKVRVLKTYFGKFHSPRKVDNSFLGRASAYRHCPPLPQPLSPTLV